MGQTPGDAPTFLCGTNTHIPQIREHAKREGLRCTRWGLWFGGGFPKAVVLSWNL